MQPSLLARRGLRACSNALAAGALALVCGAFSCVHAATASVPYVPTPQIVVERMLEIAKVGPDDYVIDLGSGDGRIIVTAAKKFGARGFGVDLNPARIDEANANARSAGVTDKVSFHQRDLFETDLAQASVITMYLLPRVNLELRPKILDLKPGTRIVSHDFSMDDWKPDLHEELEAKDKYGGSGGRSDIYFWIVPAKVAGRWQSQLTVRRVSIPYEFTLTQQYQAVSGSAQVAGRNVPLQSAKISGDTLTFDLVADVDGAPVKHTFTGRIYGDVIMGTADLAGPRLQSRLDWNAKRAGAPARAQASAPSAVAATH